MKYANMMTSFEKRHKSMRANVPTAWHQPNCWDLMQSHHGK